MYYFTDVGHINIAIRQVFCRMVNLGSILKTIFKTDILSHWIFSLGLTAYYLIAMVRVKAMVDVHLTYICREVLHQ